MSLLTLLPALALAQPANLNLNQTPIIVKDEGTLASPYRAVTVDCRGTGVTCTQSGAVWTLTVAGGGGGGSHGAYHISHLLCCAEKEIWIFVTRWCRSNICPGTI